MTLTRPESGGEVAGESLTSVTMFSSACERCGIAAYTRGLIECLERSVAIEIVPAPAGRAPAHVYRALGVAMNAAQVAHVQHSYAFWGGMSPFRSAYRTFLGPIRRPLVVTVHEIDERATGAHGLPPALETAYKRRFNRRTFISPQVSAWIVHSGPLAEALARMGAPERRIAALPMPAAAPVGAGLDAEAAKRDTSLSGRTVLTIPGFLVRRKGYDLAIAALRDLPEDVILVCAGGPHPADASDPEGWIRQAARAAGLEQRVRVTGYLSDAELSRAIAASDLVLAPFHEMSASASLSLALAHGRPVLASDLPANRQLGCLALFPAGDPEALAAGIRRLIADPAERARLAEAGRRLAEAHRYPVVAEATLAIYRQVLSEAGRHGQAGGR